MNGQAARFEYPVGTRLVDCGDHGEITDITERAVGTVYTVEFDDGDERPYPASELKLGIVDGTIRVKTP